jgi:DNA-binding NarL/FixJ family response regulator
MEKLIRVLVANTPRLMRELILTTFADQPDIEIVGEVSDEAGIPEIVDRTLPDALVISQNALGERPSICDIVLQRHPALKIIAVASDQNYSVHYWASFDIHSRDVEPSEAGILDVLRSKTNEIGSAKSC